MFSSSGLFIVHVYHFMPRTQISSANKEGKGVIVSVLTLLNKIPNKETNICSRNRQLFYLPKSDNWSKR